MLLRQIFSVLQWFWCWSWNASLMHIRELLLQRLCTSLGKVPSHLLPQWKRFTSKRLLVELTTRSAAWNLFPLIDSNFSLWRLVTWFSSVGTEGLLGPSTPNKAPSLLQIETWNVINQWRFCQFWECQALRTNPMPPLKTFWRRFWLWFKINIKDQSEMPSVWKSLHLLQNSKTVVETLDSNLLK